ncbi:MAG: amidohydrolase family protein [Bryobacterales bacterium]|nr:amidohydrolase family protein [Bryobacterales bacterium]
MMRVVLLLLAAFCLRAAEPVDSIWSAKYVVTMDAGRRVIEDGAVAVRGERIVAVGRRAEIERQYKARRRLARPQSLIAPGLIDTHTHAPMSLFRGLADDLRLQEWLEKYIFPAEAKNVDAEFVKWGTRLACLEMVLSGTTTYTDMYYFEEVIAAETKRAGLRGVLGQTVIGFPAPDARTPQDALARAERFIEQYRGDPLIVPAVAPHAIYTTPDDVLKASRALANKYGVPMLIHLSETKRENADSLAKRKMTPTALLDSLGALNGRTLGAHGVWLDDNDLRILKERGTGLAHCPSSNSKLASGVARVPRILEMGIPMGLGTDGFAGSNNDANLFEEMDLAAKLQKVTNLNPVLLPATQALEMATITGARALGLDKEIGSLEPGKRADMITVMVNAPNAIPMYHVMSQMVYALKGANVNDVMVNGRLIVRDRRVLTLDAGEIARKVSEYQARVSESLRH